MSRLKLSLALALLAIVGLLAILGVGLVAGTSHGGSGQETQQQRAFQRWRDVALPLILQFRQALSTAQAQTRAPTLQTRILTAERTGATLAHLAATLRAQPPISSDALRPLNQMLAQAIGLAEAAETTYALALRDNRAAQTHRAHLQLEHASAVMFYLSLRANALGSQLYEDRPEA